MPLGGGTTSYNNPEKALRAKQDTAEHREYTVAELGELLTADEMLAANHYQVETGVAELLDRPLPSELTKTNPLGCIALTGNTAYYDDTLEDAIEADPKVKEILTKLNDERRAPLLRSRRSVLGYLIITGASSQSDVA